MDTVCNAVCDLCRRRDRLPYSSTEKTTRHFGCRRRDHPEVFVKQLLPFAVIVAACVPTTPVVSSKAYLGAARSEVLVDQEPRPAALELVKIFTQRGFPLADMQNDERGIWLHLKGSRRTVAEPVSPTLDNIAAVAAVLDAANGGDGVYQSSGLHDVTYGSAFWVRIEPTADGKSNVSVVGRLIRNGAELCASDAKLPGPCVDNEDALTEAPGAAEAEVVQGVFAEMRLGGSVMTPDTRPTYEQVASNEGLAKCRARRAEQMELANRISNVKARANVLGALPVCE
jgi:hypothetical protein